MDDAIGGNQRRRTRRVREIYHEEDDRTTMQRRRTNGINEEVNEAQNGGAQADDERLPLSLSLGPTSYPSRIPPMSSSPNLAPPSFFANPMTTWPSPDLSYFMMTPPYLPSSSLTNSLYQIGSSPLMQPPIGPPVHLFPQSAFPQPSNQTPTRLARSVTSAVESRRISNSRSVRNEKSETIPQPFPWATNRRGWIQTLEHLESKQITIISGDVQCKHCEKVYQVSYNLREKFAEVENIFLARKRIMRERAPPIWTNPEPVRCELCGREKAVKPVIAEKKSQINWLFLLLGQTLGYCTLEQLKNFCKHCKSHRTGAKDRVLYLTYLGLCKMLEPNRELFSRETTIRH